MILAVILILLGILFLGVNFEVITPDIWSQLIKLWPVILIIIGVGIIVKRVMPRWLYYLVVSILLILMVLGAWYVSQNKTGPEATGESLNIDEPLSSNFQKLELTLKLGAQDMEINDITGGLLSGNIQAAGGAPKYKQNIAGNTVKAQVYQNWKVSWGLWRAGNQKSASRLLITNQIPVSLILNLGATSINADLSRIKIDNLTLNTGAFNGQIKIGKLSNSIKLDIRTGASEVNFQLPKDCGMKVDSNSGLVSTKYTNIDVIGSGNDRTSNNYDSAQCKIDFNIKSGASSFEFVGY